ncbi:hypothetical protein [Lentilactobacillus sp. Marseille-Q4993]|uniref:hypothetical protein n=1 Tax=Lentilactobacillus sp. Marseille-Q4993 TaxID=3039492 RepID=UPI0024BC0F16|nr:hypothetical protein [Lentilactobacillus sp. Marseille-Q4993]
MGKRLKHTANKPHSKENILIALASVIIVLLVVMIIVVVGGNKRNQASKHKQQAAADSSVVIKKPTKKEKSTPIQVSNGMDNLAAFTSNGVEDPETRTNGGDITYSRFYYDEPTQKWHWLFNSSKRGEVEDAVVSSVTKQSDAYLVNVTSSVYEPGTKYQLKLSWISNDHLRYNINTAFKNINGNYWIGKDADDDFSQTYNTNTDQSVNDWLSRVVRGSSEEVPKTRTNDGEITYSHFYVVNGNWFWTLRGDKQGLIVSATIVSGQVHGNSGRVTLQCISTSYPNFNKHFDLDVNLSHNLQNYTVQTGFAGGIYGEYEIN